MQEPGIEPTLAKSKWENQNEIRNNASAGYRAQVQGVKGVLKWKKQLDIRKMHARRLEHMRLWFKAHSIKT